MSANNKKERSPFFRSPGRAKGRMLDADALAQVRALLGDASRAPDLLVEHLHRLQDHWGYIGHAQLLALAREMALSAAEVYEVASFYHHFDLVAEGDAPPPPLTLRVCDSISCELAGAEALISALEAGLGEEVRVQRVPCVGRCDRAPVAVLGQRPLEEASPASVEAAVDAGQVTPDPGSPLSLQAYRAEGGYEQLVACHQGRRNLEDMLATLEDSGLRGLGGAGFPLGRKWRSVRGEPAPRLVVVNIDEGEPGTFKDRYYLERDPHRALEGALLAAWAMAADAVYLYLRDEYAQCRTILTQALAELEADPPVAGLPAIHLRRGAGAYICGEESALIESLEGRRGMPRLRPPLVAQVGLFGRPTLEQNLESLYWVRDILERGPDWFSSQGRRGRQGFRSFSVSGRVRQPGVHRAPAGISLNELIDEYCGGMAPGHELKAFFPGGASGGILPASRADLPLDFDTLQAAEPHCFIGSAAIIVLSQQDSVRQAALNAMRFFRHESCGQCTPCRVGTAKAAQLMEADCWSARLLHELGQCMADASICGLGQAAPNPMLSVFRHFPEEVS